MGEEAVLLDYRCLSRSYTIESRKEIIEIAMFLVMGFGLGLRGEEVVEMDIISFLTYFEAGRGSPSCDGDIVGMLQRGNGREVVPAAPNHLENAVRNS
jgi:hypothetical protein